MKPFAAALAALAIAIAIATAAPAQDYSRYSDDAITRALAQDADVEMIAMVPMRDGVGLATNIYRPRGAKSPLPTILSKTPYNELSYKVPTSRRALEAVKRGYAFVAQNERGRYYSEGKYEILGRPRTDGYDTLSWIARQPWSNGKVGTLGCSSSAEWQLALAAQNHPAHAAMVPMASGAGIGKVGPFQEQGNWYTGGVPRTLFFVWLYGVDNPLRAQLPAGLDQPTRARIARYNDLDAKKPEVNWPRQIRHLPVADTLKDLGEPPATFEQFHRAPGPGRPRMADRRALPRRHGLGCPRFVVQQLVRRVDRAEHGAVQSCPRRQHRLGGQRQPVRGGRAQHPLRVRAAGAGLHVGGPRAGRRELRHRRSGLRLLRSVAEG